MKNGLYALRVEALDGVQGTNTGVMMLRDGIIRGGDSLSYYVGSYSFADGRWTGELVNRGHAPDGTVRPILGRRDVGIGFSGTYADGTAEADARTRAGEQSIHFKAELKMLVAD
jgi:hypothetical protein